MSRMSVQKIAAYLLDRFVVQVRHFKFDVNNGTRQLGAKSKREQELVDRAVQYGRMRAYEDLARMVSEGAPEIKDFVETTKHG